MLYASENQLKPVQSRYESQPISNGIAELGALEYQTPRTVSDYSGQGNCILTSFVIMRMPIFDLSCHIKDRAISHFLFRSFAVLSLFIWSTTVIFKHLLDIFYVTRLTGSASGLVA